MDMNNNATTHLRISNLATHSWPPAKPDTAALGDNIMKDDTMDVNTDKSFSTLTIQEDNPPGPVFKASTIQLNKSSYLSWLPSSIQSATNNDNNDESIHRHPGGFFKSFYV